ncbi:MAG TPA: neutral/alkaline non-lysosomal ceramidase N-terminal domain-containing protein [Opitutaceae bacterium]|nr:neutral/alkaline non-lysosomal ceramidase N-terminal domain-containing protein [Opitutaceae bacterium]
MPSPHPSLVSAFASKIGVARVDITPPIGIYARSWGLAKHDVAEGIHRPLTATVCALGDSPAPMVLISVDLGWWKSREDEAYLRSGLLSALSLPESHLLISFSHTHAGPSLSRDEAQQPGGELITPYLAFLKEQLIAAARAALQTRQSAHLSWRWGRCDLATHRDLPEPGTSRFVVGYNPQERADDTLLVGQVIAASDGKTIATLVNYACHPTTLAWDNRLISPDFPGAMREVVERETQSPCLFLQGASGELAPAEQYKGDTAVADRHGRRLGHAVLSVLNAWPDQQQQFSEVVESGAALATTRTLPFPSSTRQHAECAPLELALKPMPSIAEIERELQACTDRTTSERLRRARGVRRIVGEGSHYAMPLWIWKLGEAYLIATPSEAYSALQETVRHHFPQRPIAVLNVTNGYVGYLPPSEHASRDQYSVWQSPFQSGSLEKVIHHARSRVADSLAKTAAILPS